MKKVALIMESWKRYFTTAWPIGFMQKINESGEDVCLYIFNSSDGLSYSKTYQAGEYNIYRLPDFSDFDGAIVDLNNIRSSELHTELVDKLTKANIPVLSLANDIEGFTYVGIDNYSAMKSMIEHVHKVHGCKKYYFVMGPEENYETIERARALHDYVEENGIDADEDDFYYENYEYDTGVHGFIMRVNSNKPFPEAIICCNDNIAVGVCETAKEYGYKVPEDLIVTGYDNFDKASYYIPRITTIGHVREDAGYKCAELLLNFWKGEEIPKRVYTDTVPVMQESCGCHAKEVQSKERLRDNILASVKDERFDELAKSLDYDLLKCSNPAEMMTAIIRYIPPMNVSAFYVVLDDNLNTTSVVTSNVDGQPVVEEGKLQVEGYPDKMRVALAFAEGRRVHEQEKIIESLFPTFSSRDGGVFLFMPIHFQEKTIGYIVVKNAIEIMGTQFLFQVLNSLTAGLHRYHRKIILEKMNQVLSDLYVKDSMTGLYNRLGMMKLSPGYINSLINSRKSAQVIFIDLDKFKSINDNYGHGQGDFAITLTGKVIEDLAYEGAIAVRNGGDEFVIIQEYKGESETKYFLQDLQNEILKRSMQNSLPYEIGLSAGYSVISPTDIKTFEMAVKEADDMMYAKKQEKGAQR